MLSLNTWNLKKLNLQRWRVEWYLLKTEAERGTRGECIFPTGELRTGLLWQEFKQHTRGKVG